MPRGPKGEKRPADVIGNAVHIMQIATGEIEESFPADDGKNKAAQELGRIGGKARAQGMSAKGRKGFPEKRQRLAGNRRNGDSYLFKFVHRQPL